MKLSAAALAVVLACLGAFATRAAEEEKPKPAAASLEELDKRLADAFAKGKVPGVSVTIIEGGQIVFTKGYGLADVKAKKPVTPETVFRAGSISKSFTAIGVMMLVEEGKVSLDAKLSDLTPELKFENAWEKTDPIRLVHLLEHTTVSTTSRSTTICLKAKTCRCRTPSTSTGPTRAVGSRAR